MLLNLFLALSVVFIGSKTREIEKSNENLITSISKINDNIKINKIELLTHQNSSYLKSLHSLYFSKITESNPPTVVSFKQLLEQNNDIKLAKINK